MIKHPKLAWAMAMDSGVRSQLGPILEELDLGAKIEYTKKGGAGASHGVEYTPIYSRIKRMEREHPSLAAVGHVLCHPSTEAANAYLDAAAAAVEATTATAIPNWGDGRAWSATKKERVHYLVRVALMERQRNLSGENPDWGPERIGSVMADWYGMAIVTRKWAQDWMPVWSVIQASIDRWEGDAMEPISDTIGDIIRAEREAA